MSAASSNEPRLDTVYLVSLIHLLRMDLKVLRVGGTLLAS